ncbi:MAG: Stringent starvation protein B [Alphaproteobacteria bacterium]|nr:Stringent starvation protein B [Alphaproteobacteria bacterium]
MINDLMRYDLRIQSALRGVVRNVLIDVARNGLPGDHHFFIAFRTAAAGVQMSQRLREQYPDEMTVVLQHQFWDLHVGEKDFEVGLSFKNIPEKLVIPFEAVTSFVDPYIQFALKFEVDGSAGESEEVPAAAPAGKNTAARPAIKSVEKSEPKIAPAARKDSEASAPAVLPKPVPASPRAAPPASSEEDGAKSPAKVIALDAFRKKSD